MRIIPALISRRYIFARPSAYDWKNHLIQSNPQEDRRRRKGGVYKAQDPKLKQRSFMLNWPQI
jgi:hypothetical protein